MCRKCVWMSIIYLHPTALPQPSRSASITHTLGSRCDPVSLINALYFWAPWDLPIYTARFPPPLSHACVSAPSRSSPSRELKVGHGLMCTRLLQTELHLNNDGLRSCGAPGLGGGPSWRHCETHPNVEITWNYAAVFKCKWEAPSLKWGVCYYDINNMEAAYTLKNRCCFAVML